jgi:hypothetical protein
MGWEPSLVNVKYGPKWYRIRGQRSLLFGPEVVGFKYEMRFAFRREMRANCFEHKRCLFNQM